MNYFIYPVKNMNISQSYTGSFSHSDNFNGNPNDFPIDECGKNTSREYLYCPCDEMEIKRIYGVKNSGTNTIWLTSTSKVNSPYGYDYMTMMVIHPEDDDLSRLKVGQRFKRGEPIFREGKDGYATGNHFHLSFGVGNILGNGWRQNNKGVWVLYTDGKNLKPEEACYLDKNFTNIINKNRLNFKDLPKEENTMIQGIDISRHQGTIDFSKVKNAGIKFAILRAGYGKYESQKDSKFDEYIKGCLDNGIDVGIYWFSYALNVSEATEEAKLCAKIIEPYKGKIKYPVYFDYEYDSESYAKGKGVTPTKELRTNMINAFCTEIENNGWRAGNYTNLDYIRNRIDMSKLSKWELWLADYTGSPDYECGMQQTGSTGKVNGISGNVDMDTSFIDYPTVLKQKGYNGLTPDKKPDPSPDKNWVSDTTNDTSNPVLIKENAIYTVKITGEDIGLVCGTSGGNPAAFKLVRCRRENNYTLWHVVPVGFVGQEAGIYPAGGGDRIFVARIIA